MTDAPTDLRVIIENQKFDDELHEAKTASRPYAPRSAWFLLYDGTSADGLGSPTYCGRTTDPIKALDHFIKCRRNVYSTGKVVIITDDKEATVHNEQTLAAFITPNAAVQ
jgi:hypothetical protein